ncbi:MAG TPA: response regulator [candidate division Zixibacteria bacterium]|nr:response regulator [candidate division Zixibacteria bacterium]
MFQPASLRGRALIMDDEELVRNVARKTLTRRGLEVEVAVDADEACERFAAAQRRGCPFQVVILDLTIPGGGGGREALQQLLRLDPAVKAIVCSGYSNAPVFAEFRSHGFFGRVRKPFHPEELVAAVRSALDEGHAG